MTSLILEYDKTLSEEVAASISSKILYPSNEKIRCNEKYAPVKQRVQVKKTAIFRPDCHIDPVRYHTEFSINSCDLFLKELSKLSLKRATEICFETKGRPEYTTRLKSESGSYTKGTPGWDAVVV
jgi:hypothetical protein